MDPLTRIRIGLAYVRDHYRLRPPSAAAPPPRAYDRGGQLPPARHVVDMDTACITREDIEQAIRLQRARSVGRL
ncbi:hypothetical protein [Streptomyces synnematoformans]|uniref:Uncharacterized protein n=1 Tax=Streptomyces synnematoformans TaxID=415721 RepID=A0ABN2XDV9_9ACTN